MSATPRDSRPAVLTVMNLPPFYLEPLRKHFTVYERLHETDPAAFAKVAASRAFWRSASSSRQPSAAPFQRARFQSTN